MKNFSLGITIGAIFKGADAFGSALSSSTRLGNKLKELNAQKINLAREFGKSSIEVAKLNTSIGKVKANMMALNQIKLSTKNLEEYRNKFKSSIADKIALGASIVAPLKAAIDFESAMADVKKVVDFDTPKQFKEMEDDILKLGRAIPIAHDGIANLVAAGGQAGIARKDLLAFSTDAGKMAVAFDNLTADKAGEMMAKWRTGFKMSQDEVRGLSDQINYLANVSASSTTTLASILTDVGALGEVGGLSASSILALGTTMASVGVSQDVAATGIKNFMLSLVSGESTTKTQEDAFKKLGLTSMEVAKGMQADSEGTVLKVLEQVAKLDKAQQASTLQNLFGKESLGAISPLLTNLDNLKKNLDAVSDKTKYAGSVNKEYDTRSGTTANNLILLGNTISEISIRFGSLLLPAINTVLEPLRLIGVAVSGFVTEFPTLSKVIGTVAVGAVALSIGFSAIGYMASFVIGGLISVGGALVTLSSLFLTNPIALAVTGIAVAAIAIYKYWEPIKSFFSNLWTNTKTIFSNSWNKIKNIFSTVWDDIKNIFSSAIGFIKTYLGWTPLGIVMNNWGIISRYFSTLWMDITKIFETSKKVMIETFNGVVDYIKIPFDAFFKYIEEKFKWISDFIKSTIGLLNSIGDTISQTANSIGNKIADISYDIGKDTVDVIGDSMKAASKFFIIEDKTTQAALKSKLEYTPLSQKTDAQSVAEQKKKAQGEVTQTNHISVVVNNPTDNIQVEKAVTKALKNQGKSLSDKEY